MEGALTLPEGIANPDGLKAIVKVTVEEKETPVKKYTVSVNVKDSEKAMELSLWTKKMVSMKMA